MSEIGHKILNESAPTNISSKGTLEQSLTSTRNPTAQWHRDRLFRALSRNPVGSISSEELEAHFTGMPERYWSRVSETELVWGLQSVHRFLNQLVSNAEPSATVVMDYRHCPQLGCTKILVCTWDHIGLLTQIAGYLSALRLNVIKAEAFTRADNIVLDVFWVTEVDGKQLANAERLTHLNFLLEGGLIDPPRFASTWARESHKHLPRNASLTPQVEIHNDICLEQTVVTVEASERLGLLHDMLEALCESGVNVTDALIDTVGEVARDTFYITDRQKRKIVDPAMIETLRAALAAAAA